MLVSEILRIKGTTLYTTTPQGTVRDSVKSMAEFDIGSLVVMDHGKLVGMLTFREVMAVLDRQDGVLGEVSVDVVMEAEPLTTDPHMEVMELRRTMLERHARYVPVVEAGTLMGVVSFHDVAKAVYEEQSFENKMLKGYIKNWPDEEAA
ncbi:MAG: CBS domain-containing protein [Betaproteobacteria bacterium]